VAVEYRWAENQYDRLPALAADLVRRRVTAIVAISNRTALVAKAATTTIPIVFTGSGNPVALGLVASLNRPRANLTGFVSLARELAPKQLQLLRALIPDAALFGILADPAEIIDTQPITTDLQAAARTLRLRLVFANASTDSGLETAFASFSQERVGAVLAIANTFYNRRMEQLAALAARHALPAIYPYREYAQASGLISYGSNIGYLFQQVGVYAGRILKGEHPADLPVMQPSKFEFVINLKTAKALGGRPPTR
jgi:putative ABC transport system substrate-binding protein